MASFWSTLKTFLPTRQRIKTLLGSDAALELSFRLLLTGFGGLLIASTIIYGSAVFFENVTSNDGKLAREIEEENLALQVDLNRLQAYKSIATKADKAQGLHPAKQIITLTKLPADAKRNTAQDQTVKPSLLYGY